eukprot:scaffold155660_cov58-Attheya_sp.AAC.6
MSTVWHPPIPIKDLFEQLQAGAAFATEGDDDAPCKPAMVRLGYNLILKTGLFDEGCRDWHRKAQPDHTMLSFKKHFKMWEKDCRLMLTSGSTAGYYHDANHVAPPKPIVPPVATIPLNMELGELRAQLQANPARHGSASSCPGRTSAGPKTSSSSQHSAH